MGVPGFFKWLSLRYPHIVETVKKTPRSKTDFLYLDINALFHVAIRSKKFSKKPKTPRRVLSKVFKEMDNAFSVCEPQILVYIAMDGVAPRAKMNEQRSRRYLAQTNQGSSDSSDISTSEPLEGDNSLRANHGKGSGFFVPVDSVAISAGTSFMQSANDAIKFYIYQRLNGKAKNLQVIFNDSSVAGEGEHKVFQFLNAQRKEPGYNSKFRHIVCGGDADFIMYALLTHEPNLRILRPGTNGDDVVLYINKLRKHILHDMVAPQLIAEINEENIIEDFVCIVNLLGNDFMPRLTHLGETRVDLLFRAYRNYFNKYRTYITNKGGFINMEQFLSFIKFIGERKFYNSSTSNLNSAPVSEVAARANDYIKTICWALQYYSGDCPSWKYYYPHHKPPSIEEILRHVHAEGFDQTFNADTPMRPFEQLMCIIPPVCHYLLPEPFHDLLTGPKSPIIEYYPTKFSSSNFKAILPFIDEKVLSQAMMPRYALLGPEDARRNEVNGYVHIYAGKNSTTYSTIYSLCMARGGKSVFSANSVVFGQLYHDGPKRSSVESPINEWHNINYNSVVNAEFRLPNILSDSSFKNRVNSLQSNTMQPSSTTNNELYNHHQPSSSLSSSRNYKVISSNSNVLMANTNIPKGNSNSEERPNAKVGFFTNQHRSLLQGNTSINSTSQFRNDGTVLPGNASNLRNFTTNILRSHTPIPSESQNVIFQSQVQNRTRPADGRYFVDQNVTFKNYYDKNYYFLPKR
ncbi:5198_t:CDS:1 [Funneliformis caledonium]|uniref:5198_t:CDS:1 n=1 Tax=Funneliformis caledonium TaxID=1117310 RepID=A0A9N9E289_9GLOM|nr:5198_t:CDS:1 [Funneliformis caledonium]